MLAIDHVIVIVEDLDAAARRYYEQRGLASVPGGVTPATAPPIASCHWAAATSSSWLSSTSVEAASSPLGSWVERRLVDVGESPAALCLRTDDIEDAARRTGRSPS